MDLWGFFTGRWVFPVSEAIEDEDEFIRKSGVAYSLLLSFLDERLYQPLRLYQPFMAAQEPAREAWAYMRETFEATDCFTQITLQQQMSTLELKSSERNEEYLNRMDGIKDELEAVGHKIADETYMLNLLRGLPNKSARWKSFKSTCSLLEENLTLRRLRHMLGMEQKEYDLDQQKEREEKEEKKVGAGGFNAKTVPGGAEQPTDTAPKKRVTVCAYCKFPGHI